MTQAEYEKQRDSIMGRTAQALADLEQLESRKEEWQDLVMGAAVIALNMLELERDASSR